jgi:ribosomal protein L11 methyltransferase
MMANGWVDVCIHDHLDVGELLSRLDDPTLQGAWEEEGVVHLYWADDQWNDERLTSVRSVLAGLVLSNDGLSLSVTRVPAQDWNETWTKSVKPLRIGRLVIRPSWEPVVLNQQEIEIILDPKQAFGTGHHATTRMLLEWLQRNIRGGELVLDVGTGSAILAMAAVKLGAASAIGIEIDPVAVDCARDYVMQNGLESQIEIVCGTVADIPKKSTIHASVVLANLDRHTILSMTEQLAHYAHSGARLVLSGVLVEQEAEIVERFSHLSLTRVDRREEEGWVALTLLKLESCEGEA